MNILLNCNCNTITKTQDNTVLLLFSVIAILIIGCIIMVFYFSTVQPKIRSSYLTAKNKRLIKNIRVGEVWHPSFPDADPFTRYSIIEEAIIMNIELNAYGEYYIQYEIMGVLKSQKVEDFVFFYHKKDSKHSYQKNQSYTKNYY